MNLVPISLAQARAFIADNHRHNAAPQGWKFGVGLEVDGQLVGVATAGRPVARMLDDGLTVEVTRVCTLGDRNANSRLYGAVLRAAQALGYRRAITYTLESESGSSLRAVGFEVDSDAAGGGSWSVPSRPRVSVNLFGERKYVESEKRRWVRELA